MSTDGRSRRIAAGLSVAAGLLLVALALPRAAAYGMIAADGGIAQAAMRAQKPLSADRLLAARDRYSAAHSLHPSDGNIALDLGRLDLRHAHAAGDRDGMAAAEAEMRDAAASMPNNTFVWTELARTALLRDAPAERASAYLRLSWLTGRFERSAMRVRPAVALAYWDSLSADLQRMTRQDIERMWEDRTLRRQLRLLYLSLDYPERVRFLDVAFGEKEKRNAFFRYTLWKAGLTKELERLPR
ncbi:hypothetical protein Plav_1907 [Parvibaculum lavamentivorans DS-1]|uniref:Uncharacterized protein n=1 Tax=Parvibaculum lavamentivorans (strain DS-1 / DSM 13023 / NCIMB 13966) TaxID=402881 RepID=A7HUD9_PARL1|nr:hypothetical protein [Parvibaculum lavamentivorans]ABS63522.1 hypothetical protein Plav_1907 [Parvibaculum lavamentivorans DS-1]